MLGFDCVCFWYAVNKFDYFTGKFALCYTFRRLLLMLVDDLANFGQGDKSKEPEIPSNVCVGGS